MDTYGLIGYPLSHSFSKKYFSNKFESEFINAQYQNFEIDKIELFTQVLSCNPNLKGLNVTIPYKQSILPYLNSIDIHAQKIGAVNCIQFNNNKLIGFNTDYLGFIDMIQPYLNNKHKKAIIFGNGGASKAIQYAFDLLKITYLVVTRNGDLNYENITDSIFNKSTIWVNTTPIGMHPNMNEKLPLRYDLITNQHLIVDLIYNPEITKFLEEAQTKGAIAMNGYQMLLNQAAYAWKIWNNSM